MVWFASIFNVTLPASGNVGIQRAIVSLSVTLCSSTNSMSSVATYWKATAPLRKCMAVVAGTPSIESPNAWAVTMRPSSVTSMMAALRWSVSMAFCTILAMAAACGDRDVVTCADFDAELVHAASETADRQSEIAILSLTTLTYSQQNQKRTNKNAQLARP